MLIERMWSGNELRNLFWLVACPKTGEAAAIDPYDPEMFQAHAKARGWRITQVWNTHEHYDHIDGNARMVELTGASLTVPVDSAIPGADREIRPGDVLRVGECSLEVLHTPGHTMCHLSFLWRGDTIDLLCGDTLFQAGVGNCHSGDARALYRTIHQGLADLPGETRIHSGHDYIENNLKFAASREPDNARVQALLAEIATEPPEQRRILTLAEERDFNPFLRLNQPTLRAQLAAAGKAEAAAGSDEEVFVALRSLRDAW